ncbi:MAG: hypothetical protein ACLP1W_06765 [Rhodomicrobium sp.]
MRERFYMRTIIMSAGFGLTLAIAAFGLTSLPVSAVEAPAVKTTVQSNVTKVDEREEREHRERCERVRRECRERHGDHEREFLRCVADQHC